MVLWKEVVWGEFYGRLAEAAQWANLLQENGHTQLTADGETRQLRLGVATKAQADQASRSLWLPNANEYYSDITFD